MAVQPEHIDRFLELSALHAVESTIIGTYTDSGKLHITYDGKTCAYVDMDLMKSGFPQWEFDAEWVSPSRRGLYEPVLNPPVDFNRLLLDILSRPNIASKEWITRQYDHEVQGTSVIKPLVALKGIWPAMQALSGRCLHPRRDWPFPRQFSRSIRPSMLFT